MKWLASLVSALFVPLAPSLGVPQVVLEPGVQVAAAPYRRQGEATGLLATRARLRVQDVRLVEALRRLQESSGVPVAYSPALLPPERIVTCECAEATVEEALGRILEGTAFGFVVAADQLVIRRRPDQELRLASIELDMDGNAPLESVELGTVAPPGRLRLQGTVSGRVVTAGAGRPLSGVQVHLPGLDIGGLTNPEGRYLLQNVPAGEHEIVAQNIGYYPASRVVNVPEAGSVVVDFALEVRAISLQGLVVTGVAAETPQSLVPFTVEQVSAAEVQQVAHTSVGGMLQGTLPGVAVVQGSGLPGSEPSFLLRGPTSISGSQDPLFVVDGVILGGGIADINPQDIQSIEVVKGAAAAALYGSRAQAGVIQITTKSGAGMPEGENQVTLRTTFETNGIEHYLGVNGGNPWRTDGQGNFVDAHGNPVELPAEGRQLAFDDGADGSQATSTFADGEYPPPTFHPQTQFLDPGIRSKTHVAVRGNLEGTRYYVSGAYEREEGVITLLDPMEQRQVRLNLTQALGENFRLSLNSYLSDRSRHLVDQGFITDITWMTEKANLLRPDSDEPGGISAIGEPILVGNAGENPVNRLINTRHWEDRTRFIGGIVADYTPFPWLTLSGNLSFDRIDQDELEYERPGLTNLFGDPPTVGSMDREAFRQEVINASMTLASNRQFGDLTMRNRFRWLAERQDWNSLDISGADLAVDRTPRLGVITGTPDVDSRQRSVRSEGLFLINQFTYGNRYIADILIRYDGSSLFGEDERWQPYWRVSGAWRISQEPWFNLDWITELKPRYSIGTAGGRPAFAAQYETYAIERGDLVPTTLGNAQLKPELATEQEIGLDAVFANRLQITANYVDTKVENQLLLVPLPSKLGFQAQWQNAGTLESQTWELSVEAALIDRPNMRWTAQITADRTRNEITDLNRPAFEITGPGLSRSRMLVKEGESLGAFYGFEWLNSCEDFVADMPCDQFDVNDMGHLVWVGEGNTWRDGVAEDRKSVV